MKQYFTAIFFLDYKIGMTFTSQSVHCLHRAVGK